ncbi:YgdI/YgdR family lipoprotein [Klebsiella pneumoniae]|uniref:YgdI/YgdR family lipoprotein n=1 Tax=Klebsiella pneumoniae TaxID=573 RepID=UPI003A980210
MIRHLKQEIEHLNTLLLSNDGRTIVSDGKPKESDSGLLGYTDANGVKQQINKTDVKEVSEIPH